MSQFIVNNVSIEHILTWIKSGEVAIPEIQRPFVWVNTKVRDLIDSLYNGYPVGYIIVWKNPDVRLKDGAISLGKKVLIDGQQRITALTAAIVGIDVISSDYKKKKIKIAFNPIQETFEVWNMAIQKDVSWIPDISKIFEAGFNSYAFIENYFKINNLNDQEEKSRISNVFTKLSFIKNINLGIIELAHTLDIETVTEIFIRINSKGVPLSNSDFVISKISSNDKYEGNEIRKILDYFCHIASNPTSFQIIKDGDMEFSNTQYFKTIAWVKSYNNDIYVPNYSDILRVVLTFKFRRGKMSDLINLLAGRNFETREYKEDIVESSFRTLKEGILDFVNQTNFERYMIIVKSTGIINKSLIKSQHILNFGYSLYLLLKDKKVESGIIEKVVRKWLVLSVLTARYSGGTESTIDLDIKKFVSMDNPLKYLESVQEGELSDAFWNNILITKLETSLANSPYFNVFLMAQIKLGDNAFLSSQIDIKSIIEQQGDKHHIFPKNYLRKNGIDNKNIYNQVANLVYVQSEINIKLRDNAPKVYMEEISNQCKTGVTKYGGIVSLGDLVHNLKQNCIPEDIFNMDYTCYSEFLLKRRKLMANKIKEYYESLD